MRNHVWGVTWAYSAQGVVGSARTSDIESNTDPDMILFLASDTGENTGPSPTWPLLIEID